MGLQPLNNRVLVLRTEGEEMTFMRENMKLPMEQKLAKIKLMKKAREGKAKSLIHLRRSSWKPFSNEYVF